MIGNCLENVRKNVPLVHNITNYVTVNDVANVLLACGGSPIMSDEPDDVADITSICGGLNINIGTLNKNSIEGMFIAGKKANELSHKILLDPVGAGASKLRTDTAVKLAKEIKFDVIRGNISEIKTLALGSGTTKGVDADVSDAVTEENLDNAVAFVKDYAKKSGCVIAITGAIDLVSDGEKCYVIRNGRPEMSKITGTGCQLSGMTTAFIVANPDNVLRQLPQQFVQWDLQAKSLLQIWQKQTATQHTATELLTLSIIWMPKHLKKEQNMNCDKKDLLLYAVTDRAWLNGETLCSQVEKAIKGGATFIQLREKNLDQKHFLEEALEIQKLCKKYNVPFVINDNVEIAKEIDADGVHVGQSDMEAGNVRKILGDDKIIGVSAQTVEQALLAQKHGADYLGVGAVFKTGSKDDADDVSHDELQKICEAVDIPVIAIGGISSKNVTELKGRGIVGIAVISAIFAQPDITKATAELKALTEKTVAND